jgi:hypothetical protein
MNVLTFKYPLKKIGLHIDFLRLKCGADETFLKGMQGLAGQPHAFIAFAEWDAVVVLPCERLYPPSLNDFYGEPAIATSIAGNAGYFSYLWEHPINDGVVEKLDRFSAAGVGTLISLRFEDWVRNKLGLAAELLICDGVHELLKDPTNDGISAIVAHTLGWNDVAILMHASRNEHRLTDLLSKIRILTLSDILAARHPSISEDESTLPIFAASYTHLIGSYKDYHAGTLSLGGLCEEIIAVKLLVRVPATLETEIRLRIDPKLPRAPDERPDMTPLERMPSEMGHYSFSANVSALAQAGGAMEVMKLVRETRAAIGELDGGTYSETSTIFTFEEKQEGIGRLRKAPIVADLQEEISAIAHVLKNLPNDLAIRGASTMTIHRFSTLIITLLDHLSDPVRSSAVRHAAAFVSSIPDRIGSLSREEIDDLCHVCEAAVGQAIDGIAQFQHDANSIGLSGRGGYNRLIVALEMFTRDLFVGLRIGKQMSLTPPLITFGLRTGTPGSLARFQIDIPFRVVFTPSDWYILVHEIGHLVWLESFGWMSETIATWEALSREIFENRTPDRNTPEWEKIDKTIRAEFLSTRSIVRELFPNLLVFRLACGDDLKRFDELSLHHVLRESAHSEGTRSLMVAVVLHVLLDVITSRPDDVAAVSPGELARAKAWWLGWQEWRNRLKALSDEARRDVLRAPAQEAIDSVSRVLVTFAQQRTAGMGAHDKQKILGSTAFREAVVDALTAVIDVLALSGSQFTIDDSPGARLFQDVQNAIEKAVGLQLWYEPVSSVFASALAEGQVFAFIPPGHVWLWLLLDAEDRLRPRSSSTFMVSQLSVVLSMWHRSVTARPTGKPEHALKQCAVIENMGYASPYPHTS